MKIKAKVRELNQNKTRDIKRPPTSTLTTEERLKVIANLIVDRIIEDQQNGTLRMRTQTNK